MGLLDDVRGMTSTALARLSEAIGAGQGEPSPEQMMEMLRKGGLVAEPTDEKPRAMFHDPYSVVDWGGWRERPSALTYESLRTMATRNTVIAAIVQLRTWQVAQFAVPQQSRYDKGFKIVLRDRRDKKKAMTPAEQKEAQQIERMLMSTGFLLPNEKPTGRDTFRTFLKKSVRDILIYDQWCFEKIRDRRGQVSRFICLPAETIRPAVVDHEHMDPVEMTSRVSHVQVYEDTVIAEFSPEDIAWCVMNPRSDLRVNDFGFSPIEQLIQLVTAWLFGFEYNQRFFSQGSAVKGVLNIKGTIPDRQLRAFRRMWYAQVSGVTNAWRTPILNSDDIQWISMHSTNREMEFSAWMDWLTKLTCAIYGVDPVEINFQYGNTGQSSSLNQPDNEKRITESKDKGLRPLMDHIEDSLNQHIVWELNPDFEFDFVGLDAKSEEAEREARIKEVQNYRTIDEVRADMEEDPLPNGQGKVILNTVFLQFSQAQQAQQQQGGEDGVPPIEGEGEDDSDLPDDFQLDDDEQEGGPDEDLTPPPGGPQGPAGQPPKGPGAPQPPKGPQPPQEGGKQPPPGKPKKPAEDDEEGGSEGAPTKRIRPPLSKSDAKVVAEIDELMKSLTPPRTRSRRTTGGKR